MYLFGLPKIKILVPPLNATNQCILMVKDLNIRSLSLNTSLCLQPWLIYDCNPVKNVGLAFAPSSDMVPHFSQPLLISGETRSSLILYFF